MLYQTATVARNEILGRLNYVLMKTGLSTTRLGPAMPSLPLVPRDRALVSLTVYLFTNNNSDA